MARRDLTSACRHRARLLQKGLLEGSRGSIIVQAAAGPVTRPNLVLNEEQRVFAEIAALEERR